MATKLNKNGFTVVESLIFLTVTALIFSAIAITTAGQIERNRAREAIAKVSVQTRDAINDVITGYYPYINGQYQQTCTAGPNPTDPPQISTSGSVPRGSQGGCVFGGKKITFNSNDITIDTLVASSSAINPIASVNSYATYSDITESFIYPGGLEKSGSVESIYILYKIVNPANPTGDFTTGAQSYGVFEKQTGSSTLSQINGKKTIDFCNGEYNSSITINPSGDTPNVDYSIGDKVSSC